MAVSIQIKAPEIKPVPFGLFSVADVRDDNDPHWQFQGFNMENLAGCGSLGVAVQPCNTPASKTVKVARDYPSATPYTAYARAECAGPADFPNGQQTAIDALHYGEERAVEKAVMTALLTEATDKTPSSGPLPAAKGVALLEGLWGQYGGAMNPTFHLDRTVAHLAWGNLDRHGNHLETELGGLVAAGAGYFDPAYDESTGLSWIVVTGPYVVMRGVMNASPQPVFVGGTANTDNTWFALAERSFAWAHLCGAFKVQVNSISDLGPL